ncbi:hypothetical protein [Neorhizobium alkalisoli]|uniref:Uncharacterized protein n=1 Tax=Neorhizobium alkalisoli TaxID=528178 RepID=A0A561QSD0_9HYPH|nr:hypothetical protein [Neorhizobium alkalisoli]TWF53310.1 hypothetical protein FHW37_104589 [Neorhizobium alkalisoli]
MPKIQPGAAERGNVIAHELGLPRSIVTNTMRKMKEAGLIAAARPVAPTLYSRDVARILLALCAPLPVNAPFVQHKLGSLVRLSGDGAVNAETELTDLLDESAGLVAGDIDFRKGEILISSDAAFMVVSGERAGGTVVNRTYRAETDLPGMRRIVQITLPALHRIAQQLL